MYMYMYMHVPNTNSAETHSKQNFIAFAGKKDAGVWAEPRFLTALMAKMKKKINAGCAGISPTSTLYADAFAYSGC